MSGCIGSPSFSVASFCLPGKIDGLCPIQLVLGTASPPTWKPSCKIFCLHKTGLGHRVFPHLPSWAWGKGDSAIPFSSWEGLHLNCLIFVVRQRSLSVLFDFFFRGFTVLYNALVDNERRKAESHGRDEKTETTVQVFHEIPLSILCG